MPEVKRKERLPAPPPKAVEPGVFWGPPLFAPPGPRVVVGPGGTLWPIRGDDR